LLYLSWDKREWNGNKVYNPFFYYYERMLLAECESKRERERLFDKSYEWEGKGIKKEFCSEDVLPYT